MTKTLSKLEIVEDCKFYYSEQNYEIVVDGLGFFRLWLCYENNFLIRNTFYYVSNTKNV